MQYIIMNKSHRNLSHHNLSYHNLSLIRYKSSTILQKPPKYRWETLRLYIFKVFEGHEPYCRH